MMHQVTSLFSTFLVTQKEETPKCMHSMYYVRIKGKKVRRKKLLKADEYVVMSYKKKTKGKEVF